MRKLKTIMRDESGVALLMVLLIATVTLAVTTTMLYMLVQSTRYSGASKRYATASEAAQAAVNIYTDYIARSTTEAYKAELVTNIDFWPDKNALPKALDCENQKITLDTSEWSGCDSSILIDTSDTTGAGGTYDARFQLGNCKVFSKIVYTFKGNTVLTGGAKKGWRNTCVVHCQGGTSLAQPIYSSYIIEVDSTCNNNPNDRSRYSVHFQF